MLSIPPATTTSAEPARKRSVATIAAFMPEPHILLIVVQPAATGSPAPSEAWRAGAWPCPAGSTQPIRISSTLSGDTPARSTAAEIARAPSAGAATSLKPPRNPPIGVRAAPTMTIASSVLMLALPWLLDDYRASPPSAQPGQIAGRGRRGPRPPRPPSQRAADPFGDHVFQRLPQSRRRPSKWRRGNLP